MENLSQALSQLIQLVVCLSPCILIALVIGGMQFWKYYQRQQRKERLKQTLATVRKVPLPQIKSVIERGEQPQIPLTKTLVGGAKILHRLSRGDLTMLEKRTTSKFLRALGTYKSKAAYGNLPNSRLEDLRQADLERVDRLMQILSPLDRNAENGDGEAVRELLQEADAVFAKVYDGHIEFYRQIGMNGVKFPIHRPVPPSSKSLPVKYVSNAEHLIYLRNMTPETQAVFMMQYEAAKKDPTVAVLLTIFLGGIGGHKFYLGQPGWGVLYLLFVMTGLPALIATIEIFTISGYVREYNARKAAEIARALM